jgi:hypothetical protein
VRGWIEDALGVVALFVLLYLALLIGYAVGE